MAAKISRRRASETGLSTTATSSGLFEEARARPPGAVGGGDAHTVDGDDVDDRRAGQRLAGRRASLRSGR